MAVIDRDLGDGAEHEAAGGCEIEDAREDAGDYVEADEAGRVLD